MSIEAILARRDLHLVIFCGSQYVYGEKIRLKAALRGEHSGVKLEIEHLGYDFHETIAELWAKWCKATTGLPELAAPMIEHQPSSPTSEEIPF